MPDLKGIEVHDLLGLAEPTAKLLETVSCGIGKIYEPWHMKRMAKAKAKELEIISSAFNDNLQLPIKYEGGNITIDTTDANELLQRAQNRFIFQEMKKQQNIDSVVGVAYSRLERVTSVSNIPVDSDWISEFFDNVANVSNEKMQILWGKILAGEVENPGQFSKRTLDSLKKLTQNEAEMFREYAKFVMSCPLEFQNDPKTNDYFIPAEKRLVQKYNIKFPTIIFLNDAGLLTYDNAISAGPTIPSQGVGHLYYRGCPAIEFTNSRTEQVGLYKGVYLLTSVGKELLSVIENSQDVEDIQTYLEDCKDVYCSEDSYEFEDSFEIKEKPIEGIQARVIYKQ